MLGVLGRLAPVLHLTRVTTAFAAVANIWFVILWSRADRRLHEQPPLQIDRLPEWAALACGAVVGVGLYAYGVALNDILDVRRDRSLHPERPIPSGRVSVEAAVAIIAGTLIASILGAAALGPAAVLMTCLTAGALLAFNAAARFIPAVGVVALGLIYAAHMLTPNPYLKFLWPVWVVMTHALLVGAVTHRLAGRRPALTPGAMALAVVGWLFWSSVLLGLGRQRVGAWWPSWVEPAGAWWVGGLALAFVAFGAWKARTSKSRERAAERLSRYGALWLALYDTAWLWGEGLTREAMIVGALALAGLIGMTVLRELYGLAEHPVGYRR